jgi:ribonuclease Z
MQNITIIPLGTSAAAPTAARNVSGTLLRMDGTAVLIDCGEGTQHRLQRSGWRAGALELILIGHLHGDHVYGLPGLLATLGMQGRTAGLTVAGPPGLRRYLGGIIETTYLHLPYPLDIIEAEEGTIYRGENFSISVAPLQHRIPAIGFAVVEHDRPGHFDVAHARELGVPEGRLFGALQRGEAVTLDDGRIVRSEEVVAAPRRGRRVVYCCDTEPCDAAVDLARDCDLLIHEATYANDLADEAATRGHSTAAQAAHIALRANARRLLLTHLSARYSDVSQLQREAAVIFPETTVAEELVPIEVTGR